MQDRKIPVTIKIIVIDPKLLVIAPSSLSDSDLIDKCRILEKQLIEYGLVVDVDYVRDSHTFKFRGECQVVRALYAIPSEVIQEVPYLYGLDKSGQLAKKSLYALNLTPKSCLYSEVKCVKQAQKEIFNQLVNDIHDIHKPYSSIKSAVIEQLAKEILFLSSRQQDDIFEDANLTLLFCALHQAYCQEKSRSTVKPDIFSVFRNESKLASRYDELIQKYIAYIPQHLKEVSNNQPRLISAKLSETYLKINIDIKKLAL